MWHMTVSMQYICDTVWHHDMSFINLDIWYVGFNVDSEHSGLQQSARAHIRVSVGDEKWSNSHVPAACKQPTKLPLRDA